ncbi:(2Fe-2S)-binding protein [Hahella sp. SMD15-11]|uniref:(2Fe-2S)-binding protein n=1 Tax=Thermohahella caldifontis TaxID=3142973 RepID=A0AB39UXP3_9GAMM
MKITINGQEHTVTDSPDTPLLWVIRDSIGLKGTKFGCGRGFCGACTVLLGDQPVRSCSTPLSAVAGQPVTTIEGIGSPEQPHPLQQAWMALNVPQCGYCQSGQIMSAYALLRRIPDPDDDAIRGAMAGNICRCGTYPRIQAAIRHAARQMVGTWTPEAETGEVSHG